MKLENIRRQPFGGYHRVDVLAYLGELTEQYTQQLERLQEELGVQEALVRELSRENERLHLANQRVQGRDEHHAAL